MAGAPKKKGLDYFPIDCVEDDSLQTMQLYHGVLGYGVLVKLWRRIYMIEGYYCDWTDRSLLYFAKKEVDLDPDLVTIIINRCMDEGIFSRDMYERFQILTSTGVQETWLKIVTAAKRKDVEIEPDFNLLQLTPEVILKTPEVILKTPEEIQQSKVKKSKVDKPPIPPEGEPAKKNEFDFSFIDEGFTELYQIWISYRRSIGKTFKTQKTLEANFKYLKSLSKNDPVMAGLITEQSINNQYQGLFPLKNTGNETANRPGKNFSAGNASDGREDFGGF